MANEQAGVWGGKILLDISNAMAGLTKLRQEHLATFSAMSQSAGVLTSLGDSFLDFGKMAIGALFETGKAFGEFERKMDYVAVVSGATGKDLEDLTNLVKRLGADTIYTNTEVADGFTELAKAGVSAQDILAGVGEGITYLGAAADIGLGQAATIMMSVVQTWGMAADEAVSVADRLSGAANASMVDIDDLGTSLKYAGSVASALGIDFDEVNTALGLLGERSIKGSQAGTSLRMMMLSLIGRTKPATAVMEELGIITEDGANQFFNASGEAKGLSEVMDILNNSMSHLTAGEKTKALKTIFDTRAMPAALTLMEQGAEGFERMSAAIEGTLAQEVASARLDNLSGDLEYLSGEIDNLMLSLGEIVSEFLRPFVQWAEELIAKVNFMSDGMKKWLVVVTAGAGGLTLLIGIIAKVAGTVIAFAANIGQLIIAMEALAPAAGRGATALLLLKRAAGFGLLLTIISAVVAALVYFFKSTEEGQAIWASFMGVVQDLGAKLSEIIKPLMAVGSSLLDGLGGALKAVVPFITQLVENFTNNFLPILMELMPVIGQIAGVLSGVFGQALQVILPLIMELGQVFIDIWAPILPVIAEAVKAIADGFNGVSTEASGMEAIGDILKGVFDGLMNALPIVVDILTQILIAIVQTVAGMLPILLQIGIELFTSLVEAVLLILPLLLEAVVTLITTLLTALIGMIPELISAGIELFNQLITALLVILPVLISAVILLITQVLDALITAIPQLIQAGVDLFMALVEALPVVIPLLITALMEAIPLLLEAIVDAIPLLLDAATELFTALIDATFIILPELIGTVIGLIPVIITSLISMIPALILGAVQLFMAIVEALPMIITELIPAILGLLPTLISTVLEMIPDLIVAAKDLFMAIVLAIPMIIGPLVDALWKMGEDMIQGLIDGLAGMGGAVMDAIGNVVNGAVDWAKGLLGIKSPSKVFKEIGDDIDEGLAIGIKEGTPRVTKAMDKMMKQVKSSFDSLNNDREKAMKKLSDLEFKAANAKKYSAATARQIEEQKAYIAQLNAAVKKETAAIKNLEKLNKDMLKFANERDIITSKLKAAQKNLEKLESGQYTHYGEFIADMQSAVSVTTKKTSDGMIHSVEKQIEKTKEFNSVIQDLKKRGLDQDSLNELIEDFMSNGSMTSARALAESSDDTLKTLANLRKQLGVEAEKTALTTGDIMYKSGIQAAQGLVDGLESQLAKIDATAKSVADTLVKTIKKQLGIKSPSKVTEGIGDDVMAGLVGGIASERDKLKSELLEISGLIADFNLQALTQKKFEIETMLTMRATDQAALSSSTRSSDSMMNEKLDKLIKILSQKSDEPGETYNFGDILIPIKDLEQLKDIEEFIRMIRVYKRQRGSR